MSRSTERWVLVWSLERPFRLGAGACPADHPLYHWWCVGPVEVRRYVRALPPRPAGLLPEP